MNWHDRVLEELIYERVRVHVDLLELIDFERDLNESIGRALRQCGREEDETESLARRYLTRAWDRVEQDWERDRTQGRDECPICEGPQRFPPADPD